MSSVAPLSGAATIGDRGLMRQAGRWMSVVEVGIRPPCYGQIASSPLTPYSRTELYGVDASPKAAAVLRLEGANSSEARLGPNRPGKRFSRSLGPIAEAG